MRIFARNESVPDVLVETVEGRRLERPTTLKELLVGDNALLVESRLPAGASNPPHSHHHESLTYLVAGRVRLDVEGETFLMEPGDAVLHRAGAVHSNEVLEDAVWVEMKAPPERTWNLAEPHPVSERALEAVALLNGAALDGSRLAGHAAYLRHLSEVARWEDEPLGFSFADDGVFSYVPPAIEFAWNRNGDA